ncbi:MAG: CHASE2 domain-containing protein, partial [Tepidisphaeraceae bacterium]
RMVSSGVKEATTPTLTEAARYCGFVDILPSADGVVRSVPLWVRYNNRMMPQAGLALACAFLGVDIQSVRIYPDHLVIPQPSGANVVVPMHGVDSDARGELGLFMDIPWFGGSNWETMYDYPDHRQSRQHIAINRVWDICEMSRRIADNNQAAANDVEEVLALTDIDALNAYHGSTRPSYDDAETWNRLMIEAMNKVDAGTRMALLDPHFQSQNEKERDFALALRNLQVRAQYNTDQTAEQQRMRDTLRSEVEGKAVLIGPMATSMGDLWRTPLHVQCPGVVMHGVIFNAIVTGYFWQVWPMWMNLTAVLCFGLAATAAATWLSPRKGLAVTAGLVIGYLIANGLLLFAIWRTTAHAAGPIVVVLGVWLAGSMIRILSSPGRRQPAAVFASLRGKGL